MIGVKNFDNVFGREVILRKKVIHINIGAMLFIYKTTTDLKFIEINY
jgi:hypothetical protein